ERFSVSSGLIRAGTVSDPREQKEGATNKKRSEALNNPLGYDMDAGGELNQRSHILFLSDSPLRINFGIAGPEEAKNRAGRGVLRLGSDSLKRRRVWQDFAYSQIKF